MPDSNVSRNATVVALPADLIFGARIRASGESAGVPVVLAKTPDDLIAKAAAAETRLVILDLDRKGLAISGIIQSVKATTSATVLAYVSHVREAAIREAKTAGADKVIARGAFANQLVELLKLYG